MYRDGDLVCGRVVRRLTPDPDRDIRVTEDYEPLLDIPVVAWEAPCTLAPDHTGGCRAYELDYVAVRFP